jgi:hypothetical protein
MKNRVAVSVLFLMTALLPSLPALAQRAKKEKILTADEVKVVKKEADDRFAAGNFDEALPKYQALVKADPQNETFNFRLGFCYLKGHANKALAADYLEKGISPKDKTKENTFYLGLAYHYARRWDEAVDKYSEYKSAGGKQLKGFLDPGRLAEMCENGQELEAGPAVKVTYENMGKLINTPYDEYSPMVTADGEDLVFSSRRKGNLGEMSDELGYPADVFLSSFRDSMGWSKAKSAGVNVNTDGDEEVAGINPMGDVLIICLNNRDGVNDLAMSMKKGKSYQKYVVLNSINNPKDAETTGCVSNDGKTLYFSMEPGDKDKKNEGQGGSDLYVSHMEDNGNWGTPENMGPDVNSYYDEKHPMLSIDGKTLFFASQGFNSMGGFDIFKTVFDDNTGSWGEPVNLGPPVNTPDDELSFSMAGNGREAYMSVARDDGMGQRDIYKLTFQDESIMPFMTVMTGRISCAASPKLMFERVELKEKATGRVVSSFGTPSLNTTREYVVAAPAGEYQLVVSGSGVETYTEDVSFSSNEVRPNVHDIVVGGEPAPGKESSPSNTEEQPQETQSPE